MLTANAPDGERVEPAPGLIGECPVCCETVHAKCGRIVVPHFAHEPTGEERDCDDWSERDTKWHRDWQSLFPYRWREVVIGPHRADIHTPTGLTVELQRSSISYDEIQEREDFYGPHMLWIFDAKDPIDAGRLELRRRSYGHSFRWKHPRKSLRACRRPILLDIGSNEVLRIERIHLDQAPFGGWGKVFPASNIVRAIEGRVRDK